jgi:hypothetical protein
MGLVILATIFLIPFYNTSSTLYAKAWPLLTNLGAVQNSGSNTAIAFGYVTAIAFLLLIIAGLVGIFPLGTGVIGVVAVAILAAGTYFVYPNSGEPTFGIGFYVVLVASVISLGASFWHRRQREKVIVNNNVTVSPSNPTQ